METKRPTEKSPNREEMLGLIEKQRPDLGEKLKRLLDKKGFLQEKNVYGELTSGRQIEICYDSIFRTEYLRCRILESLRQEARSVKQVAEILGLSPREILWEMVELRRKNLVGLEKIEDRTPLYRAA